MLVCYYLALRIFNCSDRVVWLIPFSRTLDFLIKAVFRISSSWLPYSDHAFSLACLTTCCMHIWLTDTVLCSCIIGFFNFVACLVSSFHHACGLFLLPSIPLLSHNLFCCSLNNILEVYLLLFSRTCWEVVPACKRFPIDTSC